MEVRYPPLKRGISAILARYPMKTRQMGAIPPSAMLSRKGIARYGGVSRTGPLRSYSASQRKENAAIFAVCDCDAHRRPRKSLAIFETLHCDLRF